MFYHLKLFREEEENGSEEKKTENFFSSSLKKCSSRLLCSQKKKIYIVMRVYAICNNGKNPIERQRIKEKRARLMQPLLPSSFIRQFSVDHKENYSSLVFTSTFTCCHNSSQSAPDEMFDVLFFVFFFFF